MCQPEVWISLLSLKLNNARETEDTIGNCLLTSLACSTGLHTRQGLLNVSSVVTAQQFV